MQILRQYGDLEISFKNGLTLTACNVEKKGNLFLFGLYRYYPVQLYADYSKSV